MAIRRKITLGTVRFILRTNKISTGGLAPIYLRYSYKGVPKDYFTGHSILPYNWDKESREAIYVSKPIAKKLAPDVKYSLFCSNHEIMTINSLMNELELKIKDIETEVEPISSTNIIEKLKGQFEKVENIDQVEAKHYFVDFMDKFTKENSERILPSTIKVYGTITNLVRNFEKGRRKRFEIKDIDYNYIKAICEYMASMGLLNSTINRRIKHIKGFVTKARKKGFEINPTYQDYTWSADDTDVIALSMEEIELLEELDLSARPFLERTRDVFLFACYTGLRYSDFSKLKTVHLKGDFIRLNITKTKTNQSVPLSRKAKAIIEKYHTDQSDHVFPVASSQKFNEYIKEVCNIAGIHDMIEKVRFSGTKMISEIFPKYQLISAHTARKTFVTLSLELGMKAEEIMPITGHRDYKSFKRYVNLTEKRAKEALLSAWEK